MDVRLCPTTSQPFIDFCGSATLHHRGEEPSAFVEMA
jgi:hypothetical protein